MAKSDNGEIDGKWTQEGLIYQKGLREDFVFDGGHGMIFRRNDGVPCLAMHTPNNRTEKHFEHVSIYTLAEKDDELIIDKQGV